MLDRSRLWNRVNRHFARKFAASLKRARGRATLQISHHQRLSLELETLEDRVLLSSFQAVNLQDEINAGFGSWFPPDTMGAVGPDHFVEIINGSVAIYNKDTGARLSFVALEDFFTGDGEAPQGGAFDPRVLYDRPSGHWFATAMEFGAVGFEDNDVILAVSDTSDPTGDWDRYRIAVGEATVGVNTRFTDYSTLGVDEHGVYFGMTIFRSSGSRYAKIAATPIAPLISAAPSLGTVTQWSNITDMYSSPQPAHNLDDLDATDPAWIFASSDTSFSGLKYRKITWSGVTPTLSASASTIATAIFSAPLDAPASGSPTDIDTGDQRLMMATIRDNALWTTRTIGTNAFGGPGPADRTGVEWFELDVSSATPSVSQTGRIVDPSPANPRSYYFPSIMVSGQGRAAVGFSGSSNSQFVGAYYSSRLEGDFPGTMTGPTLIKAGEAAYRRIDGIGRNRWGDYSYTTLDPEDDMTIWTIQEYAESGANIWGTWVHSIAAPAPTLDNPFATAARGTTGVSLNLTGTGLYDPGAGFTGRLQIQLTGGAVNGISNYNVIYNSPTNVTVTFDVAANASFGNRNIVLTNPDGQSVTVFNGVTVPNDYVGTNGDDVFRFTVVPSGYQIRVNNVSYFLDNSQFRDVGLVGLGGNDLIIITGGAADETAALRTGSVNVASGAYTVSGSSMETVRVFAGAGNDRANFFDSTGNDSFYGRPAYSYLSGTGFFNRADGFAKVYAYATAGNAGGAGDRAFLYDSAGNDKFIAQPTSSYLTGSGFYNQATGFDQVDGYARAGDAGGVGDRAYLYDSAGNDLFYGRKTYSYLTGTGFINVAFNFDKVNAYATAGDSGGARDRAYLYDSPGNDTFYGRPISSVLTGPGFYNQVRSFDKVYAYATAGNAGGVGDRANLYDSAGNDTYTGRPTYSFLTGSGFYNYAQGFDNVYAFANAGGLGDRAYFYDSAGNDTFYGRSTYSYLTGGGFYNRAVGFESVYAYATAGAKGGVGDRSFVYDSARNDTLYGRSDYGRLTGNGFLIFAQGFDRLTAYANQGGFDTINNQSLSYLFFKRGKWEKIV